MTDSHVAANLGYSAAQVNRLGPKVGRCQVLMLRLSDELQGCHLVP